MPYSNIKFVKLFLSLFSEDDRFLYQLNESQQLLYIKMLYMAGVTNNHITKNSRFIRNKINYHHEEDCFLSDIERIKTVFHRFKEKDGFYCFDNFEELHNYVFKKGNSKGTPKELQRLEQNKNKNKNKKENKNKEVSFPFEDLWIKYPNAVGKKAAARHFQSSVKSQKDWDDINQALSNYLESDSVRKGFVQNGSTWFNNWQDWIINPKKGANDDIPDSLKKFIKKER